MNPALTQEELQGKNMFQLSIQEKAQLMDLLDDSSRGYPIKKFFLEALLLMQSQRPHVQDNIADFYAGQIIQLINQNFFINYRYVEKPCPPQFLNIRKFFKESLLANNRNVEKYTGMLIAAENSKFRGCIDWVYHGLRIASDVGVLRSTVDKSVIMDNCSRLLKSVTPRANDRNGKVTKMIFAITAVAIIDTICHEIFNCSLSYLSDGLIFAAIVLLHGLYQSTSSINEFRRIINDNLQINLSTALPPRTTHAAAANRRPRASQTTSTKRHDPEVKQRAELESSQQDVILEVIPIQASATNTATNNNASAFQEGTRKVKRWMLSSATQPTATTTRAAEPTHPTTPAFFDEKFADLSAKHLVKIESSYLGLNKSATLYAIWDEQAIQANAGEAYHKDAYSSLRRTLIPVLREHPFQ